MNPGSAPGLSDLEPVLEVALRAGGRVMEVYGRGGEGAELEWKDDRTPLTEADRASHDVILAGLQDLFPDIPVVSEEGSLPAPEALGAAGGHWMVDPLDGTKEFLKRTGEFTVNIALIRDRRPVAGVVHAPALGRSWVGANGGGAELVDGRERSFLRVREADPERLGIVASRDHAGSRVRALLERVPGAETLSMGSSLKFCLIAEGRADLYLRDGPTMEWDTAAAQAVLEAAGGSVLTLDGAPLRYEKKDLRNPHFLALGDRDQNWRALVMGRRPRG